MAQKASVSEVFNTFFKLGLTSFGGPVAHIGHFRKELIEKRQWLNEQQFSQLLAICQFLPGPASSQLGFSLGLLRAGWLGALAAFLAFTLPSALLLIGFASALPLFSSEIGTAIIHGLKLVAFVVVADAVWGMSKKLCPDWQRRTIALCAVAATLLIHVPWSQMLVIIVGAITGIAFCHSMSSTAMQPINVGYKPSLGLTLLGVFIALLLAALFLSKQSDLVASGQVFYRAGALVFGGGHVVLPLLQDAVVNTGQVSNTDFLAGYGLSQAIPGPMFSFVAYLGAIMPTATSVNWLGATIALTFMFLPGFLLISAALPLWQSIANRPHAANAITGINAAVVGILAAALYDPIFTSSVMHVVDLVIALSGFSLLVILRLSPLFIVIWCVLASVLLTCLSAC
jgi:chromate transporter